MKSLIFIAFFGFLNPVLAAPRGLYAGSSGQSIDLIEALAEIKPGSVVVIGESHGFHTHQGQQLEILTTLRYLGFKVSVGLEFFPYTHQNAVDLYREGRLEEADFLSQIGWGMPSYDYYRLQALFPRLNQGEKTLALNAPRSLTGKVAKEGLESLTSAEKALLPPDFELGRESYKKRFGEAVPHPLPPEKLDKYFAAQSIWDDTMAWRAQEFLKNNPEHVLVIIVGEFHVQYGGGLPDRLKSRGLSSVLTISQVDTQDWTDDRLSEILAPSPDYGVRADYLWLAPLEQAN